jgi:hypothetical protein
MANYSDLIISEYIEGSSNNKALEFFNGTGAPINLTGYSVQVFFNGAATASLTINLAGTVAPGDVFVLAHTSANATILAQADQTNGSGWFNGDDAITLRKAGVVIDSIGQVGVDPGSEWGSGLTGTADNTLRRMVTIGSGDTNTTDAFDPATQWVGFVNDSFGDLGTYTPEAGSATPVVSITATDAAAAEAGANAGTWRISRTGATTDALTITYTVGGTADAGDFGPALSGSITLAAGQASADISIVPVDDALPEGNETVVLTLVDGASYDLSTTASATVTIADDDMLPTRISAIQGSGATSPMDGQVVVVEAVVVGDYQGSTGLSGFFLQEESTDEDGNPNTSEGLFVFQGASGTAVNVGDVVRVTGTVDDFGNGFSSLTELTAVTGVVVVSSGHALPAPVHVSLPTATVADLEAYEGMRVAIDTTLTVTDTFTLGRYGEVLLSADGPGNQPGTDARLDQYTQFNLPSASGNAAYQAAIAPRMLLLDDGSSLQNTDPVAYGRGGAPLSAANTLRGGDTVSGLVGILDDRFGTADTGPYRLQPTQAVDFQATNARTANPGVSGNLVVASFNVLNYFNGPTFPTSRGADNTTEFARQRDKIVAAIIGTGADVVGLLEIENDGYGTASAIQSLVNALNAVAGAGTYAFVNPGTSALGGDEIAVGMLYKPAKVSLMGAPAILDSSVDPRFDSSVQRPSLAQTFRETSTGELFTPVINHLKSKGSVANMPGDGDQGDGQGASNTTRTMGAEALVDWLARDPTGQHDKDFLILGDLNAYAMEDPVRAIEAGSDGIAGNGDDFRNLLSDSAYSYSFGGQWGALDHALGSASLGSQVSGAAKWHINADEPTVLDYNLELKTVSQQAALYSPDAYRSSDHDPVVIGLNLGRTLQGTVRADTLVGSVGNDRITGGQGRDLLSGLGGADTFVYTSVLDGMDRITDFAPGVDHLDIQALLTSVHFTGTDPVAAGYLTLQAPTASGTVVLFDVDGSAGSGLPRALVELAGVALVDAHLLLAAGA